MKSKKYDMNNLYFPSRLLDKLDGILDYPLTIVEAPMGYGKTTAVKEFLNNSDAIILWLRVYDGSLDSFWNEFARLAGELKDGLYNSLIKLGFPNDAVSAREALGLISSLDLSEKYVLVIDDYHLIDSPEIDEFIEKLTTNEIENFHVVLNTRFSGFQRLEEYKLKGLLHHITKEAFELSAEEIAEYYKTCGVSIQDTQAQQLYSVTEGWISALYLMMLGYIADGNLDPPDNIYTLLEKAVYIPLSENIKEFIISMSIFDDFSLNQAEYICRGINAGEFLREIINRNSFVNYDGRSKTYQIHSLYKKYLREVMEEKSTDYKNELYRKSAEWYRQNRDYTSARQFWYQGGDFENILQSVEEEKAKYFMENNLKILQKYFDDCPPEIRRHHHYALLVLAVHLFVHNKYELFLKVCEEAGRNVEADNSLGGKNRDELLGELEILYSFSVFNDLKKMSTHFDKAWSLLGRSTSIYDVESDWTFGSPSVLYLYYRESGKLREHVEDLKQGLPCYYRLAKGNGSGGEYVMEAEYYYNMGDFINAEISLNKALHKARPAGQWSIELAAMFLKIRIDFMNGDFENMFYLLTKMRKDVTDQVAYQSLRTVELCEMGFYSWLDQKYKIPESLAQPETGSIRLMHPAYAMFNIIYGRVLLINEKYTELLGSAEYFWETAAVYPNLLGIVYTHIFLAAANLKLFRKNEARENLKKALDIAMPDRLYMPFVENCDYIEPLINALSDEGLYIEETQQIFDLYKTYSALKDAIKRKYFPNDTNILSEREMEIAVLAADGLTNNEIAQKLFISPNTVKYSLKSIYSKLSINKRVHLKQYMDKLDNSKNL